MILDNTIKSLLERFLGWFVGAGLKQWLQTLLPVNSSPTTLILFVFGGVLFKAGCHKILTTPLITIYESRGFLSLVTIDIENQHNTAKSIKVT